MSQTDRRPMAPEATRIAFLAGVTISGAFVTARDSLRRYMLLARR